MGALFPFLSDMPNPSMPRLKKKKKKAASGSLYKLMLGEARTRTIPKSRLALAPDFLFPQTGGGANTHVPVGRL